MFNFHIQSVQIRLQGIGEHNRGDHSYQRGKNDTLHGRVFGKTQNEHADDEYDR